MRGAYFAGAVTEKPRAPVFSMARATSPDALVSSTEDWKSSTRLPAGSVGCQAHSRARWIAFSVSSDLQDSQTGYAFILCFEGHNDLVLTTEQRAQMIGDGLAVAPPCAALLEHWEPRPSCHLYHLLWSRIWYTRLATD
jgi:hypothetical protein